MPRGRGRVIDTMRWSGDVIISHLGLAAGSGATLALVALDDHSQTLLRTRGICSVWLDGTPTAGEAVQVACGLIKVPKGTGTTVLLSPISESEQEWLWWGSVVLAADAGTDQMQSHRFDMDSKAMRKMKPQEEIQFVVAQTTIGTAVALNCVTQPRFLLGQ